MSIFNLDFSELDENCFFEIANKLLNECYLKVNKKIFRIIEIEFYLKCTNHDDLYTHCNPDQLLMETFYFHKYKNTYKSGTYKGMDITLGDKKTNCYFGVLIRSIKRVKTGETIQGPCNVVNRILLEYGCSSIMEFTNGENFSITENPRNFIVVPTHKMEIKSIAIGPRIGLSEKYPELRKKNYRYVTHREIIIKEKTKLVDIHN